ADRHLLGAEPALSPGGARDRLLRRGAGGREYDLSADADRLGRQRVRLDSPMIIGLGVAGVVLLALFVWQERRAAEPLIPPRLWRNRVFSVASSLEFLVGFAMFGAITFLPVFLQTVRHASATSSGLLIL